jgi:hypothetical protein
LALDNVQLENSWGACGVWRTPTQWVQLYSGNASDRSFERAVTGWLAALRSRVNAIVTRRGLPMQVIPNFSLHEFEADDSSVRELVNATDGVLSESGFLGGGYRGPGQPYDYIGNAWVQRIRFSLNLQRHSKAYYIINAFGDHSASTNMTKPCAVDPHACITPAVRQWVLASYLMAKEQASGVALYQLLAREGSRNAYGNWSYQDPEWTAQVGAAVGPPHESAGGLWSRRYSGGLVLVNPWPDRGPLRAPIPPAPTGQSWRDLYGNPPTPGDGVQVVQPVTAVTLVMQVAADPIGSGRG